MPEVAQHEVEVNLNKTADEHKVLSQLNWYQEVMTSPTSM